jgi:hypothetical protein
MADNDGDSITVWSGGGSIGGSLVAALFGIVFIIGSIVLLYWNEGRAVAAITALNQARRDMIEVSADTVDRTADGKLVHLSGMMRTGAGARDAQFGVGGADLVRLKRTVEMFQWKEEETSHGSGSNRTTTYSYRKRWSEEAIASQNFERPGGHANPPLPIASTTIDGGDVRLGAYRVEPGLLANVSAFRPLPATHAPDGYRQVGDRFYRGANPDDPAIGDLRVSFAAVPAQVFSVVAAQVGEALAPFSAAGGYEIALASPGLVAGADMVRQEKHREGLLTWALRGVGFVVMLIGFLLLGAPLRAVADYLPLLGDIVGAGIFLVALTLAVPLTLLTIAIAWIVHRPLIGAGLIVLAAAAVFGLRRLRNPRPAPART